MTTEAREVLTRDRSSGRIHKRFQIEDGPLFVDERDNLDAAGEFEIVDQAVVDSADPADLCRHCFPTEEASA